MHIDLNYGLLLFVNQYVVDPDLVSEKNLNPYPVFKRVGSDSPGSEKSNPDANPFYS